MHEACPSASPACSDEVAIMGSPLSHHKAPGALRSIREKIVQEGCSGLFMRASAVVERHIAPLARLALAPGFFGPSCRSPGIPENSFARVLLDGK